MPVLYSWLRWVENAARRTRSASTRYIGSGEAASYRRLPPSEPQGPFKARTPARPDGAVFETARIDLRAVSHFGLLRRGEAYARLALRGYTTDGSVSTFTSAGFPDSKARSSAGRSS